MKHFEAQEVSGGRRWLVRVGTGSCKEGGETFTIFLSKESPTHLWGMLLGVVCPMVEQVRSGMCACQ